MSENAICICIFWYSKICWSPVKICSCEQKSGDVSRDSYIFWIFLNKVLCQVSSLQDMCEGYLICIRERFFCPLPTREKRRKVPSWIGLKVPRNYWNQFQKNFWKGHWQKIIGILPVLKHAVVYFKGIFLMALLSFKYYFQ